MFVYDFLQLEAPFEEVRPRLLDGGGERLVDGHLELSRLGPSHTHMSLLANYTPPGGYFGRLADRMGLHHLVEAGVRTFLHRFAEGLTGPAEQVAA